jgi:Tfp pilus assembly protein FimT
MTNKSKLILVAVAATLASAAPTFAQSFDSDFGTGNVLSFSNQAPVARAEAPVRHQGIARHRGGMGAFAMEPRELQSSDDPAATGGGSIGYNENLYNY